MSKDFGRLRTKSSHGGTRGPRSLTYGDLCFALVQLAARCVAGSRQAGRNGWPGGVIVEARVVISMRHAVLTVVGARRGARHPLDRRMGGAALW
jgi:hypothetical protein